MVKHFSYVAAKVYTGDAQVSLVSLLVLVYVI